MTFLQRFTARFGPQPDLLGFAADAHPAADAWLETFTDDFMRNPDAVHGAAIMMSGLRFFTADFVAQIAALPPVATRRPAIAGRIPRDVYSAAGPIIAGVYQTCISRNAAHAEIQAAFAQAMPLLTSRYNSLLQ